MNSTVEKTINAIVNRANEIHDDAEYGMHVTIHLERLTDVLRKMEKVKEDSGEKRGDGEVRKDREWLKERVASALYHAELENAILTSSDGNLIYDKIVNAIDQLDEPETLSKEWIDGHKYLVDGHITYPEGHISKIINSHFVFVGDLERLVIPKQEEVVIPQFVADDIHLCQVQGGDLLDAMSTAKGKVKEWIDQNGSALYARAWLDWPNVEVEKEKLYRVEFPSITGSPERYLVQGEGGIGDYWIDGDWEYIEHSDLKSLFTEAEIKAVDERYWIFAEEVTE